MAALNLRVSKLSFIPKVQPPQRESSPAESTFRIVSALNQLIQALQGLFGLVCKQQGSGKLAKSPIGLFDRSRQHFPDDRNSLSVFFSPSKNNGVITKYGNVVGRERQGVVIQPQRFVKPAGPGGFRGLVGNGAGLCRTRCLLRKRGFRQGQQDEGEAKAFQHSYARCSSEWVGSA